MVGVCAAIPSLNNLKIILLISLIITKFVITFRMQA
jgi:hypothetical protein